MSTSPDDAGHLVDMQLESVPSHLWNYAQDQEKLHSAAVQVRQYLTELATAASIPVHAIESRSKSLASYRDKCEKRDDEGSLRYPNPVVDIQDCVAARIIVYTTRARNDLANLVANRASVLERQNPGLKKFNGYDSEHLIIASISDQNVRSRYADLASYLDNYSGLEIQIRSVAGHAWAEYEHDTRYKSGAFQALNQKDKDQIHQWFIEAGGMRRVMDEVFERIESFILSRDTPETETEAQGSSLVSDRDEVDGEESPSESAGEGLLDEATLSRILSDRFTGQESGERLALRELLDHMSSLGLRTVGQLTTVLSNIEGGQVARFMDYPSQTSGCRRLDDELLTLFGDRYVESTDDESRKELLQLRLQRVSGKYSFYSLKEGADLHPPVAAARAVRDLVKAVSRINGSASTALIPGVISLIESDLPVSAGAKAVQVPDATVYVTTNLSRTAAENIMKQLIERVPGSGLNILRAGDVLFSAPPAAES